MATKHKGVPIHLDFTDLGVSKFKLIVVGQ